MDIFTARGAVSLLSKEATSDHCEIMKQVTEESFSSQEEVRRG